MSIFIAWVDVRVNMNSVFRPAVQNKFIRDYMFNVSGQKYPIELFSAREIRHAFPSIPSVQVCFRRWYSRRLPRKEVWKPTDDDWMSLEIVNKHHVAFRTGNICFFLRRVDTPLNYSIYVVLCWKDTPPKGWVEPRANMRHIRQISRKSILAAGSIVVVKLVYRSLLGTCWNLLARPFV